MTRINSLVEALGPFYNADGLRDHGIEDVERLIGLPTTDGKMVYSQRQFKVNPDDSLVPLENAPEIWHSLIRPAIADDAIDAWTAAMLFLEGTEKKPSLAEQVDQDPTQLIKVTGAITRAIARLRQ